MTLFVDRREDEKGDRDDVCAPPLSPFLRRWIVPADDVVLTDLSSADVAHAGNGPKGRILNVGYEIKHVGDALQCMEDGRLAGVDGQLERMGREYQVRWLIIEDKIEPHAETGVLMKRLVRVGGRGKRKGGKGGKWTPARMNSHMDAERDGDFWTPALYGAKRQVMYSTLVKYLSQAAFRHGVMLWRTNGRNETAQFLAAQYRMWNDKKWEGHKTTRTFDFAQEGKRPMYMSERTKRVVKTLMVYDNVGYERAMAAAEVFKTPEAVVKASEEELKKVLGKVIGKRVYEAVRGR